MSGATLALWASIERTIAGLVLVDGGDVTKDFCFHTRGIPQSPLRRQGEYMKLRTIGGAESRSSLVPGQRCTYMYTNNQDWNRGASRGVHKPRTFRRGAQVAPGWLATCSSVWSSRRAFMRRASPSHSSSAGKGSSAVSAVGALGAKDVGAAGDTYQSWLERVLRLDCLAFCILPRLFQ